MLTTPEAAGTLKESPRAATRGGGAAATAEAGAAVGAAADEAVGKAGQSMAPAGSCSLGGPDRPRHAASRHRRYGRRAAAQKAAACFGLFLALGAAPFLPARAQPARGPIRLLMLGDSITAGYGLARGEGPPARIEALLRGRGRDVRVLDAGVSGDTSAGGRSRLDWALADRPDAVIVALGGNDGLRGLPPEQTHANLAAILDRLRERRIPVLLAGMLAPPNLGADYGRDFAGTFERLARERPEVIFYPFLLEGVAGNPELNQPDRIHPNPRGAAILAERLLPAVESLLDRLQPGPAG
jgi:acyl-CoA thioesterase-1